MVDTKSRGLDDEVVPVPFSGRAFSDVLEMARERRKGVNEVIQEALALRQHLSNVRRDGGRILIEREGKWSELDIK